MGWEFKFSFFLFLSFLFSNVWCFVYKKFWVIETKTLHTSTLKVYSITNLLYDYKYEYKYFCIMSPISINFISELNKKNLKNFITSKQFYSKSFYLLVNIWMHEIECKFEINFHILYTPYDLTCPYLASTLLHFYILTCQIINDWSLKFEGDHYQAFIIIPDPSVQW